LSACDDTASAKSRVDVFAAHLEWCLRDRPKLKDHPVVAALLKLYVCRLKIYVALPFFVRTFEPRGLELQSQLEELGGWTFRKRHLKWTDECDDKIGNAFVNIGYSYQAAKAISRKIAAASGRGRPALRRPIVIAGMELKRCNPSLTWTEVTGRVCDCGKKQHDGSCKDNLIAGCKKLRRLFRKYGHHLEV
jgi:hypothetical protein